MTDHVFGNTSTDLKLDIIENYLNAYAKALRSKFNHLWYIDAFAGAGHRTIVHPEVRGSILDEEREAYREQRRGSARIALDARPRFDRLTFIDQKPGHVRALQALAAENPDRLIEIVRGDCNTIIPEALAKENWASKRGVMFLDPYGLNVDWSTLEAIRRTNSIDVWYLVNINGILRQAAKALSAVDGHKDRRLTRMFGTDDWRSAWYELRPAQASLFGSLGLAEPAQDSDRTADEAAVEEWVRLRLGSLFPWVSAPLRLYMDGKGVHQFSLFFAISNTSGPALGLAQRLADSVLNKGISSQTRPR